MEIENKCVFDEDQQKKLNLFSKSEKTRKITGFFLIFGLIIVFFLGFWNFNEIVNLSEKVDKVDASYSYLDSSKIETLISQVIISSLNESQIQLFSNGHIIELRNELINSSTENKFLIISALDFLELLEKNNNNQISYEGYFYQLANSVDVKLQIISFFAVPAILALGFLYFKSMGEMKSSIASEMKYESSKEINLQIKNKVGSMEDDIFKHNEANTKKFDKITDDLSKLQENKEMKVDIKDEYEVNFELITQALNAMNKYFYAINDDLNKMLVENSDSGIKIERNVDSVEFKKLHSEIENSISKMQYSIEFEKENKLYSNEIKKQNSESYDDLSDE